ncbi:putative IMP3-component of the U3 small nucleolar ribonucleo protein [Protomyces lactucae-debilis]|uniref:U3 small nucleolar ribonucleoprotein protein IMP3 n=1 Tax=Protomyces lactucae-debilis TaxID=2754530 RepID=A0A1Y2FAW3_PROLT|nr:putative IMP3-component of the U3 small nucleolar ribonucleoprotein [Protomyces lactucae-debilis]ORY81033.1 putative IMP3-component of the U3 small nucleolar ribonucleo protein [Protomyces lactucae-debilis]
MRELKHHERKLLKKVDLFTYKSEQNHRDLQVIRRYHIQNREEYFQYNKLCGALKHLAHKLADLPPENTFRKKHERLLLDKVFSLGLVPSATKLSEIQNKITVSAFCRRRLAITLCRLKMAETVRIAITYIEQGHVRVGPETVTDPAYLVSRNLEDYVTWVDSSKIKRTIAKYNDKLDDFDLLQV